MRTGVAGRWFLIVLCTTALVGCARDRDELRQALIDTAIPAGAITDHYVVACPDVLHVSVEGRAELTAPRQVQANGCIDLGPLGGVRAEGLSPPAIEMEIARLTGVDTAKVRVNVIQYKSKQVYLFGEATGLQRAVHYQGPEKVVDLLRRTGGITPDAAPDEVRVIRNPQLAQSEPLVFNVDLRAVLLNGDQRTNVTLEPYDQVYVPETKQARVNKCLHPWLRPLCRLIPWDS